jgi:excinuclease ABC subunit A
VKDVMVIDLKDEALCVKIDGLNISEVTKKSILDAAQKWFENLEKIFVKDKIKLLNIF